VITGTCTTVARSGTLRALDAAFKISLPELFGWGLTELCPNSRGAPSSAPEGRLRGREWGVGRGGGGRIRIPTI